MTRTQHRTRKPISASAARWLPFAGFRYSMTRDAYVLRVIGNKVGPVYEVSWNRSPERANEDAQSPASAAK